MTFCVDVFRQSQYIIGRNLVSIERLLDACDKVQTIAEGKLPNAWHWALDTKP